MIRLIKKHFTYESTLADPIWSTAEDRAWAFIGLFKSETVKSIIFNLCLCLITNTAQSNPGELSTTLTLKEKLIYSAKWNKRSGWAKFIISCLFPGHSSSTSYTRLMLFLSEDVWWRRKLARNYSTFTVKRYLGTVDFQTSSRGMGNNCQVKVTSDVREASFSDYLYKSVIYMTYGIYGLVDTR